jgi:hypothetical protein
VFVEKGAVVVAGLVLMATEQLQITRVVPRGSKVDYFVGRTPEDQEAILEVGGTDEDSLAQLRRKKCTQLEKSFYRRPLYCMSGFVSTTRFAMPSATALERQGQRNVQFYRKMCVRGEFRAASRTPPRRKPGPRMPS